MWNKKTCTVCFTKLLVSVNEFDHGFSNFVSRTVGTQMNLGFVVLSKEKEIGKPVGKLPHMKTT